MNLDKLRKSETTSGRPPEPGLENTSAPEPVDPATGQHRSYWVLSAEERAKGFVQPVRRSYKHLVCGTITTMGRALAETYARDPTFYTATFCVACRGHFPVGRSGDFVWDDGVPYTATAPQEKVGT